MAAVEKRDDDSGEQSIKCAHLENVIPTTARPLKKRAKQQPPTVHKPVATNTVAVRAAATHTKGRGEGCGGSADQTATTVPKLDKSTAGAEVVVVQWSQQWLRAAVVLQESPHESATYSRKKYVL
jgi:hypothetical protein